MSEASRAMRAGSVSLRLYPHLDLPPPQIVQELLDQGRLAEAAGFDGLMVSEHHNAFAGYLPNPIQAAGWLLDVTDRAWAAPCPLLLPLRPAALVAEEVAWLAVRFPRRVGVGLAAGSLEADFAVADTDKADLAARFSAGLTTVSQMLLGRNPGPLPADPAIARCVTDPVPLVSAAMSPAACRRAATAGVGLLFDSLTTVARCRELVEIYRDAGGAGPIVLIRRVAPGDPAAARQDDQLRLYRGYATPAATEHWGEDQLAHGDPAAITERLTEQANAVGADSLNLRVHVPGMTPAEARSHIETLTEVRARLAVGWRAVSDDR